MRKLTKVLAVVLSVLMALSVCSVAALAAQNDDNDQFVIDTLLDNTNFTSWQYVDINNKALTDQMNLYTALALYDSAWRNYATKEINVDDAETILLAIIEKAEYSFNDGYVDEIISVLNTAEDVNDFIQKVNQYANIELFASSGWSTAFTVISDVNKIANAYQNYRNEFVEAYAKVLSVQMANAYYIDMLQYVVDNTNYAVLKTAAQNLIADMTKSVNDVLQEIAAKAAADGAEIGAEYLLELAVNSNVYTATAYKVYQVTKSIANTLWNTGALYVQIDTLMTTYYFQPLVADYTALALDGEDADKAAIAVDMLLTTRTVSEQSLFNYKLAENEGIITRIKNKLYKTVYNDTEMMIAAVDAMRAILNDDANANVVGVLYIYGPATLTGAVAASNSVTSDYSGETLTAAFLTDAAATLTATAAGNVTVAVVNAAGKKFVDNEAVAAGDVIAVSTASDTYTVNSQAKTLVEEQAEVTPTITPGDVIDTTTEVVKETVKKSSFAQWISDFFAKIAAFFTNLFKK